MDFELSGEALAALRTRKGCIRQFEAIGRSITDMAAMFVPESLPLMADTGIEASFVVTPKEATVIHVTNHFFPCAKEGNR